MDRYTRIVLTIIATALVWLCVVLTPVGTPVSAQLGPTPVLLTGWQDGSGKVHTFNASPLPIVMGASTVGGGSTTPAPLVSQPATAAAPAGAVAAPSTAAPRQQTAVRCQATTQKGTQCSRMAKPGSSYCWQHGG